jgi:hypothetical protein
MKAKDLAALAALGVAGYAAYNKFGKKSPANSGAKAGAKLGDGERDSEAGESEARMNMRDINEGSGRRDAGGNTVDVDRRVSAPERMKDIPESRQERDIPQAVEKFTPRDKEGLIKKKDTFVRPSAAGAKSKTPKATLAASTANDDADAAAKSLSSTGGPSRMREAQAAQSTSAAPATRKFTPPGTQSSMGALSEVNRPAAGNQAMAAMDRATVPAQRNVGSGNAAMDAYSQVQAVPKNIKYATEAEKARQARIDEKNFDSDLMKGRRQAVVDTVQSIPSRVADIFKPPEREFQNKTYRDMSGKIVRYNKGGVVKKMASGGMTSSKMSSKPSTASSRGDGIAQRGKTRGKMC